MKQILSLLFLIILGFTGLSQTCPSLSTTSGSVTCTTPCATITATPNMDLYNTSAYSVSSIPFTATTTSFTTGTSISMGDDYYSSVITLPFCFSYFGNTYTQCLIGTNGNICFDLTLAGAFDPWSISGPLPGSNCNATKNAIMAPWCDMYQSPFGVTPGTIKYYTSGTAPCRTFVVSWCTPMFSCTSLRDTTQIVLHETTNLIEIFLKRHYGSCSWNSGRAVTGIENAAGTVFYTAPGENGTSFNAINEGWKFQPSGTIIPWSYSWNGPSGTIGTTPAITICPTVTTTYTATATATTSCGIVNITNTSVVNFVSSPIIVTGPTEVCIGNSINLSSSYGTIWSSSNTSVAIVNSSGVVTGVGAGTAIITCSSGLCSGTLTVTVNPTYTTNISAVICQGESYLFAGSSYNTTGIYSHVFSTVKGCDSVVNLNLNVVTRPTANFYVQPYKCVNDSITVALNSISSDVISYNWNFTPANILYSAGLGGPYVLSYPSAGIYNISLIVSNLYCTDTIMDTVQIMNYPDGRISPIIYVNGNSNVCMGDELILQAVDKSLGLFYVWTPNQILDNPNVGAIRATIEDTVCINLEVMNAFGCRSKDSVCINPTPCCIVDMPSAFTPNNDGENDKFRIMNHNIKLHDFRIANRWGQIVFETCNLNEGWNGVFNGVPQDLGVYFYHIIYECDGKQHEKKGDLTLIR